MDKEKKKKLILILTITMIIITIGFAVAIIFELAVPSRKEIKLYDKEVYEAVVDGKLRKDVIFSEGERYFSYDLVKTGIDKYIWKDDEAGVITVISENGTYDISIEDTKYVLVEDNITYIKETFLSMAYDIDFPYDEENNVSIFINEEMCIGDIMPLNGVLYIRSGPSIRKPRVKTVENEKGKVIAKALEDTSDKWIKVIALTGEVGYVRREDVDFIENKMYTGEFKGINTGLPGINGGTDRIKEKINNFKEKFNDNKINMVWEAVYSKNPKVENIGEMKGLNVIAPTWFKLSDVSGKIDCMADKEYVQWAHDRGYYVWGTVVSNEDSDLTSGMLSNYEVRCKFINDIVNYALEYNLDGINIDFEKMYEKDKMLFTQFVRDLSSLCHRSGLIVSCDVTVLSNSPVWSLCYDRPSLSDSVDYMCVMFYDQHSANGGKSGSVAQLSWTVSSLQSILKQIPNERLILGIPLYTRLWKEQELDGELKVTSENYYMKASQDLKEKLFTEKGIKAVWDDESGQYYIEYEEDDVFFKLWIEDETSIRKRVELVGEYDLAGCAAWRRGFETPDIWNVISEVLN